MVVYDEKNGVYVDIRREATGYGATPEEARRQADQAERVMSARGRAGRMVRMQEARDKRRGDRETR